MLEQSRIAWHDAQKQATVARIQLADALGLPVPALSEIAISFESFEQLPAIEKLSGPKMHQKALFTRSDLLSALADYEASQTALQLEVAKQFPDLQLGPGMLYNQGEYKWILGATLTLPILNQNEGPIAEADARRKDTAARFNASQARITGEIDKTSGETRAALAQLSEADQWLDTQTRQKRSAEALFEAGETDRLTLITARLEYAATALARLDALIKAQQAVGLLEDTLQMSVGDAITGIPVAISRSGSAPENP